MKTVHRVEIEVDQNDIEIRKGSRLDTRQMEFTGYGTFRVAPTHIISVEGSREPVELLNDLRGFAHAILDQLEGT